MGGQDHGSGFRVIGPLPLHSSILVCIIERTNECLTECPVDTLRLPLNELAVSQTVVSFQVEGGTKGEKDFLRGLLIPPCLSVIHSLISYRASPM